MHSEQVMDGITGVAVSEERIKSAMRAIDMIMDEPFGEDADWESHLRRLAIAAIEAGTPN